jgi:serine peptidase DegS
LKTLSFIIKSVILGMAAAFVAVLMWPNLLAQKTPPPVIQTLPAPPPAPASYAEAVERTAPSMVSIYTETLVPARPPSGVDSYLFQRFYSRRYAQPKHGLGSGVIVDSNGYILTSNHVVETVDNIMVALWDGRVARAAIVGNDPPTDLAVLKIEADNLPSAVLAEDHALRVGDVVLAIGNAFGLSNTVTMGIVSAMGRTDLNISTVENFIQTDAAINAGNSGGALINSEGQVVGINSSILPQRLGAQGIGFAIPVAIARMVMEQIIEYGSVQRGWLGAEFTDLALGRLITAQGTQATGGVEITDVVTYSPAWDAGLQPGDVIIQADGETVVSSRELGLKITESKPGSKIQFNGFRGGQPFSVEIGLIQTPPISYPSS